MRVAFASSSLAQTQADLLVIGVPADKVAGTLAGLGDFAAPLTAVAADEEFTGKPGSTLGAPTYGRISATRVLLVGIGAGTLADVRAAAGSAGKEGRARGAKTIALAFPDSTVGSAELRAAIEAFAEGNYKFDKYKSTGKKPAAESVVFVGLQEDTAAVARSLALVSGQELARDLVNEPADEIYPESLAAVAKGLESDTVSVLVLDETAIREKGMGGIYGVGKGSARPPRFIHMTYTPKGESKGHIAFVGKGVTFDSGGLSLKPSEGMMTMRCDMAGAAAVIGAMKAIAALAPAVKVTAIVGAVENMPSGTSYKLGDILKMYNGKNVEIHNTDAEGRLVLADCLSYATELQPDALVDLATLTGAAVVALGDWYSALYTRSDTLAGTLTARAGEAGEGVWRMPLPDLYKDKIKAEYGDIKNVGGRAGGSITAALFLAEFTTLENWAHIDIAGPAFLDAALMHYAPGGTGTMVRTLARWAESVSDSSSAS
jgi:leucyl aminopeptidase